MEILPSATERKVGEAKGAGTRCRTKGGEELAIPPQASGQEKVEPRLSSEHPALFGQDGWNRLGKEFDVVEKQKRLLKQQKPALGLEPEHAQEAVVDSGRRDSGESRIVERQNGLEESRQGWQIVVGVGIHEEVTGVAGVWKKLPATRGSQREDGEAVQ
jgi:hypothetical protein